jgi:transcriptional regulator with GAF, ATPase, and Fis domain
LTAYHHFPFEVIYSDLKETEMSSTASDNVQSMPELKSLSEIVMVSSSQTQHLQDYFQNVMTILSQHFTLPYASLLLKDLKGNMLHVEAVYGIGKDAHPLSCPGRKGMIGKVIDSQQPMVILNFGQEPLYEEVTRGAKKIDKIRPPLLCVPLIADNELLGVFNVNSLYGQQDEFHKDFQFLRVLSAVVSPVVRSFQARKEDSLARSAKSKLKLEDILEEKLTEVLNKIDPYLESKAKLGIMDDIVCIVEKILIKAALEKVGNVQLAAAELLGINRNTLRKKIKDLKIKIK